MSTTTSLKWPSVRLALTWRGEPLLNHGEAFDVLYGIFKELGEPYPLLIAWHLQQSDLWTDCWQTHQQMVLEIHFGGSERFIYWRLWMIELLRLLEDSNRLLIAKALPQYRKESVDLNDIPEDCSQEIVLDFVSPLDLRQTVKWLKKQPKSLLSVSQKNNRIAATTFHHAIVWRLQNWFPELTKAEIPRFENLHIIDYFGHVTDYEPKRSEYRQQQSLERIKGFIGSLYIRGEIKPLWPWLQILKRIHVGGKLQRKGTGQFRIRRSYPQLDKGLLDESLCLDAIFSVKMTHDNLVWLDDKGHLLDETQQAKQLVVQLAQHDWQAKPTTVFDIAKANGAKRQIEQLCYQDLLVHQHLHKLLAPVINQYLSPASMGYRKGLSKEDAISAVKQALIQQRHYIVQADIEDFFPSIDLSKLEECIDNIIPQSDTLIRQVVKQALYTTKKYKKRIMPREQGLIQGSPLSPILANLYLDAFDKQLLALNLPIIRYGDDFVIMCVSHHEAEQALNLITTLLHPLELVLAPHKTRISHLQTGFEFLGEHFNTTHDKNDSYYARYLAQRKPLLINEPYCAIGLNGDALQIRAEKSLLGIFPLRRISELVVLVPATVSTPALEACARANIPVTLALKSGYQIATLAPDSRAFLVIAAQQYQRFQQLSEQERILLAADIAASKINNSMTWLKTSYHAGNNRVLSKLEDYQQAILTCDSTQQIRGYEGAAAKQMFAYLNERIIDKQKEVFCSTKRARGGPDRLNSLLNFGYYLLFTRINGLMRAHGLNPYLGFLHDGQDDYETLVADIQELFRVHVDRTVLRLINRQQITDAHFKQSKRGWWLTKEGTQLLANQLEATLNSRVQNTTFNDLLVMQIRLLRDWATNEASLRFLKWDKVDVMLSEGVDEEYN